MSNHIQAAPVRRILVAVAGLAGVLWVGQAHATPLADGNSLTVGVYTVTVNSCSDTCAGNEFSAVGSSGFVITGAGGGTLLDADSMTGPLDVSVTFEVTTATAIQNMVQLQVGGSASGTGLAKVDETAQDFGFIFVTSRTGYAGGSAVTLPYTGGPYDDILLTKDISANPGADGTAIITSVTELFAVPEPAGMIPFGIAFAALLVRRRRAR